MRLRFLAIQPPTRGLAWLTTATALALLGGCSQSHSDSEVPHYSDKNKACGAQMMAIADTILLHNGDQTGLKRILGETPLMSLAPQLAADLHSGKLSGGSAEALLNRLQTTESISCTAAGDPVLDYGQVHRLKNYAAGADGKLLDAVMP